MRYVRASVSFIASFGALLAFSTGCAATHAFARWLYKALPYDPVTDFAPVTEVTEGYLALTVSADFSIKDVAGFMAVMKASSAASFIASRLASARPKSVRRRHPSRRGCLPTCGAGETES